MRIPFDNTFVNLPAEFWAEAKQARMPLAGGLFKVSRDALASLGGGAIRGQPMHYFIR